MPACMRLKLWPVELEPGDGFPVPMTSRFCKVDHLEDDRDEHATRVVDEDGTTYRLPSKLTLDVYRPVSRR